MSDNWLLLKMFHILGVVLFLGNVIITGWWKGMADRTGNPAIIAFAQRQVTVTDWIFTFGGVLLILATGVGNAQLHDIDYMQVRWMAWGYWLFLLSGAIWGAILIPIQIAQARMAREFAVSGNIPARYWQLNRAWFVFGILATLIPMVNLYWMVFKPQ
jgi:uncharacterized membrane protein